MLSSKNILFSCEGYCKQESVFIQGSFFIKSENSSYLNYHNEKDKYTKSTN